MAANEDCDLVSCLHAAVARDDSDEVEALLTKGAPVNSLLHECSPLYKASESGSVRVVELLLQRQADVSFVRRCAEERFDGSDAAYIAARAGHGAILAKLIGAGADIKSVRNGFGMSAAYVACQNNRIECLRVMVDSKIDLTAPGLANVLTGRSLAWAAAQNGSTECMQLLIDSSADVSTPDNNGSTPAFKAVENHQMSCLQLLMDCDADVTTAPHRHDSDAALVGLPPLAVAQHRGYREMDAILSIALNATARPLSDPISRPIWLQATAADTELLQRSLVYAFSHQPHAAFLTATRLVGAYHREREKVANINLHDAAAYDGARLHAENTLIALMFFCIDVNVSGRAMQLDPTLLEAAVASQCREIINSPRLQQVIQQQWDLVSAFAVHKHAKRFRLDCEASAPSPSPPSPSRSSPSPSPSPSSSAALRSSPGAANGVTARRTSSYVAISLDMLLWLLLNVLVLAACAVVPPVEGSVGRWQTRRENAARRRVFARNPEATDADANSDSVVSLEVDGLKIAYYFTSWPEQKRAVAQRKFRAMLQHVADEEARLAQRHFPLFQPAAKFWVHVTMRLAFACGLAASRGSRLAPLLLLLWGAQLVVSELREFTSRARARLWTLDALNALQLLSAACAVAGLALSWVRGPADAMESERASVWTHSLLAAAILLMFTSQSLCILQRLRQFGPLVVMAPLMVYDVLSFLVLIIGPVLGFAVGFAMLYAGGHSMNPELEACAGFDAYADDDSAAPDAGGLAKVTVVLLEIMMSSDIMMLLDCFPSGWQGAPAEALMIVYLLLIVLLGVNMLIAMMTSTYERVKDDVAANYMFISALKLTKWRRAPVAPAPLLLLGAPYVVVETAVALVRRLLLASTAQRGRKDAAGPKAGEDRCPTKGVACSVGTCGGAIRGRVPGGWAAPLLLLTPPRSHQPVPRDPFL